MSDVVFREMDETSRVPAVRLEVDFTRAATPPEERYKALVVGQMLAAGSATEGDVDLVDDDDKPDALYGSGSPLALALKAYRKVYKGSELYGLPLDDAAAGVQATGNILFAGTATATHTLTVRVNDQKIQVRVDSGDAAADVATAVVAASTTALMGDLEVTTAVNGVTAEQVDITAKNDGPHGNFILIRCEYSLAGAGITDTVTALSAGATEPDIDDVNEQYLEDDYDQIVPCMYADTNLDEGLHTDLAVLQGPMTQNPALGFSCSPDTYANSATLSADVNSPYVLIGWSEKFPVAPYKVAAMIAAAEARHCQSQPNAPLDGVELPGVPPPFDEKDYPSHEQLNNCLYNGLTPLHVDKAGTVRITRDIVSYQTNAQSVADGRYLDRGPIRAMWHVRRYIVAHLTSVYSDPKDRLIDNTKLRAIEALVVGDLYVLEVKSIVRNVDDYKDLVKAEESETEGRVVISIPTDIVPGLHQLFGQVQKQ